MARRQLLSNEAWAARLAPAIDDRDVIRHYTLSEDDFDGISAAGTARIASIAILTSRASTLLPTYSGLGHYAASSNPSLRQRNVHDPFHLT